MERNVHLNTTVLSPRLRKKTTIPFPWVYEILDGMVASQIIRKVDLKQGYHQIGVHREHVHRTGFWTKSKENTLNIFAAWFSYDETIVTLNARVKRWKSWQYRRSW